MGKQRHRTSSKQKEIKKQKRKEKQEQKRLQKETQKEVVQEFIQDKTSPKITDKLKLEVNSLLTYGDYRVYDIFCEKKIGYLGVFADGKFKYILMDETQINQAQILLFIKKFIREELKLTPVEIPNPY